MSAGQCINTANGSDICLLLNSLSVVDYLLTFGHESGFIRDSDCRSLMKHTAGGGGDN